MKRIPRDIIEFFQNQNYVIVSSIDKNGRPHNSCKGIVKIESRGIIYLLDLYRAKTYDNLKDNPCISISAVDEHRFKGFCLKGRARAINRDRLDSRILKSWEGKLISRISQRVVKNIHGEKGHPRQPEALLPNPEYLIVMEVKEVVDLTPHSIK